MYEKILKWLQVFMPPKRHNNLIITDKQHPNLRPCHPDVGLHRRGQQSNLNSDKNDTSGSGVAWSSNLGGRINRPFVPPPQTQTTNLHYQYRNPFSSPGVKFKNVPLCSSLDNVNSSIWSNLTGATHSTQGTWVGGRAWAPPGQEGGASENGPGSSSNTGDLTNSFMGDNTDNATYPDFYNYDYDFDQSDWLTSHLDELYELMRSSQVDINIALTVFLVAVFLVGVTGNILVLAVFSRGAVQHQASTVFIKALAVTDLIICLVVLPGVLLKEWYIPYRWDALCQGWELIRCSTIPLSTLILASVAVDRYVKICRVDRSIQISTSCAKKILLVTATISVCLGIPPMLRMGVYQAGEGPDSPKFYLGLCMGNDLLVSKETVDRYWQAMTAKFVFVLLVVTVMYGLVFRTVYKQSRRWGRNAAKPNEQSCGKNDRSGSGGLSNKGYDSDRKDEEDDVDEDGPEGNVEEECREQNCSSDIRNEGVLGYCGGDNHCERCPEHVCNASHHTQCCEGDCDFKDDKTKCVEKECHCWKSKAKGGRNTRNTIHKRTVETIQIDKKKRTFSLSFLICSGNEVVTKDPPKISYHKQDELQDDGVTSLDDGHVSYLNTPSTSSSQQQADDKSKNKTLSAIFSCTSQLAVSSKRSYVSKRSYYHNGAAAQEDDDNVEEGQKMAVKKRILFMPNWLRRWKRLIRAALFTTSAQRNEEQKSAVKLALRQNAKIRMMNQEASSYNGTTSQSQHPYRRSASEIRESSTTENTLTTKLSPSNLASSIISPSAERNWTNKYKLNKGSQSLDFEISNLDQKETKSEGRQQEEKIKCESGIHEHESILSLSQSDASTRIQITGGQTTQNHYTVKNTPLGNIQDRFVTIDIHNSTGNQPKTLDVGDKKTAVPSLGALQDYDISFATKIQHEAESIGDQERHNPSLSDNSANMSDQLLHHPPWLKHRDEQPINYSGFEIKHNILHNTSSCPLSSPLSYKFEHKSVNSRSGVGGNKVHPLNSPFFYHSVPNVPMASIHPREPKEHDRKEVMSNKNRVVSQSKYCDISTDIQAEDDDITFYTYSSHTKRNHGNENTFLTTNDEGKSISEYKIVNENVSSQCKDSCPTSEKTDNKSSSSQSKQFIRNVNNSSMQNQCHKHNKCSQHCHFHYHKKYNQRDKKSHRKECFDAASGKANRSGKAVRGSNTTEGTRKTPQSRYNGAQVKTAQVLFLVTVVYVLSFAPALLMSVEAIPPHPIPFYGYFIHSAANPILYSFINEAFRSQLYSLLCGSRCAMKK